MDIQEKRKRMLRLLTAAEGYEGKSKGKRLMWGTRYELAIQAADVNGDGCRFPSCGCEGADCARQRVAMNFNADGAEWDNCRKPESTR